MAQKRFEALAAFASRKKIEVKNSSRKVSEYFAENVFGEGLMQKHLPKSSYEELKQAITNNKKISKGLADQVASAMKSWALSKGATHYTNWFQPMNGSTAEKHESFFVADGKMNGLETFNGDALIQQKPDKAAFPTGGVRATFEARGYISWDVTSPAFIMNLGNGSTLCIPTVYVSYKEDALDYKTPLLKSINTLGKVSNDICSYFDRNINYVKPSLGWEQEYFLIDASMYYARPDLVMCGRTVQGRRPAKGQQLDDHYFGTIPERVYTFMRDFETEAFKLGIPLKTRHNEVAPSQYECAPKYEDANISVDHNLLLIDIMNKVSSRHKLKVVLHEKPFEGLNGSGKHINWSLMTDSGRNLLSPGSTPRTNLQFLTFFINTIAAINNHESLLRASYMNAGNEHRLGIDEAPPSVVSVFIGDHLQDVLNTIEKRIDEATFGEQENLELRLDLHNKIPEILVDNTDSNRTAPVAFTGNKFELRGAGASINCASPLIVLNTIVADQLTKFKSEVDVLIKEGDYKDVAILKVLKRTIKKSKRILFEGDNYGEKWLSEIKKRKLSNPKNAPEALKSFISKESLELFEKNNILSEKESTVRYEILLRNYVLSQQIESRVLAEIAINQIIPSAIKYQNLLAKNIEGLQNFKIDTSAKINLLRKTSEHIQEIISAEEKMTDLRREANNMVDAEKIAMLYCEKIKPLMKSIRYHCDKLELYIDDELWPIPKYSEVLFSK